MTRNGAKTDYQKRLSVPNSIGKKSQGLELDFEFSKVDNNTYDVSYVCLLIPRFGNHLLVGDITSYLEIWMQKICVSYSWKLTYLDIQPKSLHWIMNVSITDAPARLNKVIRNYTSTQIFEDFPRFKKDNLSNDFWALPSLMLAGRQPHPEPMIEEFIRLTRDGQGLSFWRR